MGLFLNRSVGTTCNAAWEELSVGIFTSKSCPFVCGALQHAKPARGILHLVDSGFRQEYLDLQGVGIQISRHFIS